MPREKLFCVICHVGLRCSHQYHACHSSLPPCPPNIPPLSPNVPMPIPSRVYLLSKSVRWRRFFYTVIVPITRISALYPVVYTTDISLRSISVVYATGYNADIRVIRHKYYIRGIKARGYPQISSLLRLRRKGVCLDLRDTVNAEWHKWVHPKAPNARVVWRSLVSALICKSMWYAWSRDDLVCNVRSIIWGLTIRGYPSRWWKGRVFRACQRFALDAFFTKTDILVWIEEAKRFVCDSESAGPSSGSVL